MTMAGTGTNKAVLVTGRCVCKTAALDGLEEELSVEELSVEELSVEELAVEELAVEELAVEELAVEEEVELVDEEEVLLLPPPKICESKAASAANPNLPCGTTGAM